MSKISVTDAGPIEGTFSIDLSPGPGAYELLGARGTGKSTIISSIDWLAGHKVDVTLHDGALSGKVEGFGVVAPIGGRKRRKGDLEADTIDAEKFSLTDILDPQGKTPEVRDAMRIKALAAMSDTTADPSLYHELCGGQAAFDAIGIDVPDDPVLLATRIKRAFDMLALAAQRTAEAEAKHAVPLEYVPDDLDMSQSSDLAELGAIRDDVRNGHQLMVSDRENGQQKEREIAQAADRLAKVQSEYNGPSIQESHAAIKSTIGKEAAAKKRVEELKRELEKALATVEACRTEYHAASTTCEAAKSHAAAVEELQTVASQEVAYPREAAIAEARETVKAATVAYDQGVRIRDVKRNQGHAKAHREAAGHAEKEAAAARNKASEVFDILARSLHTTHLEIKSVDGSPRLFVKHPTRGRCAFDQVNGLSDGERVDYTLRELLPHIESPGLLPIPQRVWQDLQPADRIRLHELAVEKNLFLFGAQVDDGELRVAYLGDEANGMDGIQKLQAIADAAERKGEDT